MSTISSNAHDSLLGGQIEIGKKYPIRIAESTETEKTLTMQFLFKPSSIQLQAKGTVVLNDSPGTSDVFVHVEGVNGLKESFKGTKRKPGPEYVMSLSASGFQLHKVDKHVLNLRVQREENTAKLKESSTKESIEMLESRKLPKFLQKTKPKKKTAAKEDEPGQVNADSKLSAVDDALLSLDVD